MSELVPEGWVISKLGAVGNFSKGKGISKSETVSKGIPCIRYAEIYTDYDFVIKKFKSFISQDTVPTTRKLRTNDIIFAGSGETVQDIGKSVAFISECEAYVGGDSIILSPYTETDSTFLAYELNDEIRRKQLRKLGQGSSVIHIYSSGLEDLDITLPTLPEQKKIASILTSVDEVIENTQKQIDKLQDLKKATMNELLTKGIGHTQFKDSELGRIPKSWEVRKFKEITKSITCGVAATPKYVEAVDGIPFLSAQNVQNGEVLLSSFKHITPDFHQKLIKNTKPEYGDILYSRVGAGYGEAAIVRFNWEFSVYVSLTLIKLRRGASSNFYKFFLNSWFGKAQAKEGVFAGGGVPNLNVGVVKDFDVLVPSETEQKEIVRILTSIDELITGKKRKLQQTQSLKKSLMQDLLTGKVRVSV